VRVLLCEVEVLVVFLAERSQERPAEIKLN
jgi:hypothetical protein